MKCTIHACRSSGSSKNVATSHTARISMDMLKNVFTTVFIQRQLMASVVSGPDGLCFFCRVHYRLMFFSHIKQCLWTIIQEETVIS